MVKSKDLARADLQSSSEIVSTDQGNFFNDWGRVGS
jgi:hypothetical protein